MRLCGFVSLLGGNLEPTKPPTRTPLTNCTMFSPYDFCSVLEGGCECCFGFVSVLDCCFVRGCERCFFFVSFFVVVLDVVFG